MPAGLKAKGEAALKRLDGYTWVPNIADKDGCWVSPYEGEANDYWFAIFCDILGTRHAAFVERLLDHLAQMLGHKWDEQLSRNVADIDGLRAALSMIQAMKVKDESQAAYAASLVALHISTMNLARRMGSYPDPRSVAVLAKATRTYGDGLETMKRIQGKRKRTSHKMEVHHHTHQHVHFEGGDKNGGRAHATNARAISQCTPLPSDYAAGGTVQGGGGEGQARLQDARSRKGNGRAEG